MNESHSRNGFTSIQNGQTTQDEQSVAESYESDSLKRTMGPFSGTNTCTIYTS